MEDKMMNIKFPAWLYEKLKAEAGKKCTSMAALVRMICAAYFEEK
jgi:hypothetical protein